MRLFSVRRVRRRRGAGLCQLTESRSEALTINLGAKSPSRYLSSSTHFFKPRKSFPTFTKWHQIVQIVRGSSSSHPSTHGNPFSSLGYKVNKPLLLICPISNFHPRHSSKSYFVLRNLQDSLVSVALRVLSHFKPGTFRPGLLRKLSTSLGRCGRRSLISEAPTSLPGSSRRGYHRGSLRASGKQPSK